MVTYTSAFLAAANLLALAHAAPAQPVCFAVTTVITGTPVWVPRADPTGDAGWGSWPSSSSSSRASTTTTTTTFGKTAPGWTVSTGKTSSTTATTWASTSSFPLLTITVTPSTTSVPTTTTTTTTTTTPAPPPAAPTCDASDKDVFSADPSGSCGCDFTVSCNVHAPYTSSTTFWERVSGELIGSLEECQQICNENSQCTAAIWVNRDGAPSNEYMHCWQTSGLPETTDDGYGQISYKGACSSSCAQSYNGQ